MPQNIVSTRELVGKRVVAEHKGKRIGKVRRFVFHPTERRCIGLLVKRPDAALMFHRKDMFVALGGFHENEDGCLVVHESADATDKGAVRALGVDWDKCVIWVGMPVMTKSGEHLGFIDTVSFDRETGAIHSVSTENGAANDAILGRRSIPVKYVKGFKRGQGMALVEAGEYDGGEGDGAERGAIIVAEEALDLPVDGGIAAAAGKASVVVADKAKQGAAKAKEGAVKAKKAVGDRLENAKPGAKKFADAASEAMENGTFVVGKQIGEASGMFSAFKEEFEKAANEGRKSE